MSTTSAPVLDVRPVEDLTPVEIPVDALESLAPEYLRDLSADLADAGQVPAVVSATGTFDEDCSLATQSEAEQLREYVRAASFLGANRLEVRLEAVERPDAVETALEACAERARREGVQLCVDGPVDLD